jgi:tetratricopeptide (TPR) repeat protein
MAKAMIVTLPFVLLLLDYWPLNRVPSIPPARLIVEKIPLFLLSAASCVLTVLALGRVEPLEKFPLPLRIGNALVSCVTYIGQMFYPVRLAVLYPYPAHAWPLWKLITAFALLASIALPAIAWRRERPYLLVGWLWYLGMLMPVIGLVQAGGQAHADRFTYLPQIGLYFALMWLVADLSVNWRGRQLILGVGATVVLAGLTACAWKQTHCWRDSQSLWTNAIANTENNAIAHDNLGCDLNDKQDYEQAIPHLEQALRIIPDYADAHDELGLALLKKGDVNAAISHLKRALELQPNFAKAHWYLAIALVQTGCVDEAVLHDRSFLAFHPDDPATQEAFSYPAWVLATSPNSSVRNGSKALELAKQAEQASKGISPRILSVLAAAYAETGRYPEAIATSQRAIQQALAQANYTLLAHLQTQLKCYESRLPFRDSRLAP